MTPAQVFGIILRCAGLLIFLYALLLLISGVATVIGYPEIVPGDQVAYFFTGFPLLALGHRGQVKRFAGMSRGNKTLFANKLRPRQK